MGQTKVVLGPQRASSCLFESRLGPATWIKSVRAECQLDGTRINDSFMGGDARESPAATHMAFLAGAAIASPYGSVDAE